MIRANKGERASSDVGSGSGSHDFVADASAIFFTSESGAGSNTSKRVLTTLGMSWAGSGDRLWHSDSIFSLKLHWNLVASAECDSSATSGRGLFTFRPRSESAILRMRRMLPPAFEILDLLYSERAVLSDVLKVLRQSVNICRCTVKPDFRQRRSARRRVRFSSVTSLVCHGVIGLTIMVRDTRGRALQRRCVGRYRSPPVGQQGASHQR